jgi:hypothetical protein
VHWSEFLIGVGLLAWGILIAVLWWSIAWDREGARRVGEKRWWIDRGTARRRGLTKEQWLDKWVTSQRAIVTWVGIPFLAMWLLVSFWMIGQAVAK